MKTTVRIIFLGLLLAALSCTCAYALSDDAVTDPFAGVGLVDVGPVDSPVSFDVPQYSVSYDQPARVENISPGSLSYDQAGPVNEPVTGGAMLDAPLFNEKDMSLNIGPVYEAPAYEVPTVSLGPVPQPVDAYGDPAAFGSGPANSEPVDTIDSFQERAWDSIPAVSAIDAGLAVNPVVDFNTMDLTPVSEDYKGAADFGDKGIPAVTAEPDEPQAKIDAVNPQSTRTNDIAQAIVDANKNGEMITLKGGETIYKVDSNLYPALADFMKTQMKGQAGAEAVKFVDPKEYKNNPELYHNIENGQFYVVDKGDKTSGMNIYKTTEEQIRASDKAGLPLSIFTSGIADGTVVQLVDENKKPTNLLVEYKDGVFLNAYDGRETWLKSEGDKANFYKLNSAESALMSNAENPSSVKQAILGAHEKGEEISLKGGETIYKVESSLYGMLSDSAKGQQNSKFVDPQQYKGNPELYQNPENGQLYVVDKDDKTQGLLIYKTSDDQVKTADKAGLPLWLYTSGVADGSVVQLVDENKKPSTLLIEYKNDVFINANDARETWIKGKDAPSFIKVPESVGNALINRK